jgi:hypothetical protein
VQPNIQAIQVGTFCLAGETADLPLNIAYQWLGSGWAVKAD